MCKLQRLLKAGGRHVTRSDSTARLGSLVRLGSSTRSVAIARPNLTTSADPTVRRTAFPCGGQEENLPTILYWKRKVCLPAVAEIYMQMLTGLCVRHSKQPRLRRHHPKAGRTPGLMRRLRKLQPETRHLKLRRLTPRQAPGKPNILTLTSRSARLHLAGRRLMHQHSEQQRLACRCVSLACAPRLPNPNSARAFIRLVPRLPNPACLPRLKESGGFRAAI